MKVRVLYFARVAEIAGCSGEDWQVDDGSCAGNLLAQVAERYPALGGPEFKPLLAVNQEHAGPDRALADNAGPLS